MSANTSTGLPWRMGTGGGFGTGLAFGCGGGVGCGGGAGFGGVGLGFCKTRGGGGTGCGGGFGAGGGAAPDGSLLNLSLNSSAVSSPSKPGPGTK